MTIVSLNDGLLRRWPASRQGTLRDRVLCGLCVRVGARTKTFFVATSAAGVQVRITLGRWPLLSVEQAREQALPLLRECRGGQVPIRSPARAVPTLERATLDYCSAKRLKASSQSRYLSLLRTHFPQWVTRPVDELERPRFGVDCAEFARTRGAALVALGRGLIGALLKFLAANHDVRIRNPFDTLAAAGLLPGPAKPRARRLMEEALPEWFEAVARLPGAPQDYLMLVMLSGLRRNEALELTRANIDFDARCMTIPDTKTNCAHTLPITPHVDALLRRRCDGLSPEQRLFGGVSAQHVAEMAERAGAPAFMLHDLRKLLATFGERLSVGPAPLRRILNHAPPRSDTLYRHYVSLSCDDVVAPLTAIQETILVTCRARDR